MNNTEKLGLFFAAVAMVALFALIMALPTMWLWNWALVPSVDGIHEIGFFKALGLNFLFSILFKSNTTTKSK